MKVADLFGELSIKPDRKGFGAADKLLSGIKTALIGLVGFQTGRFFAGLVRDTANVADQFNKMAQKTGIATEQLQGLEFAAQLSGTNLDVLRTGLQRFARNASDAERGLETAKRAFKDIGVAFKDTRGNLRPVQDLLLESADTFAVMENGTKKTALAMELFGRSGAELIPLLNEGSNGIRGMIDEFGDLGAVIDAKTGKAFEQFNDDQVRLKAALSGLRNQAVKALLPVLLDMAKNTLEWVKANKEVIKSGIVSFVKVLIAILKTFARVVAATARAIDFLRQNTRELKIILTALAAAFVIVKQASIAAALASFKAWVLAALPFALLVAVIAAVLLAIHELWQAFTGGEGILDSLTDKVADTIGDVIRFFKQATASVEDFADAVSKVGGFIFDPTGSEFESAGAQTAGTIVGRRRAIRSRQLAAERAVRPGAAAANQTNTVNANIQIDGSASPEATAKAVRRELEAQARNIGATATP